MSEKSAIMEDDENAGGDGGGERDGGPLPQMLHSHKSSEGINGSNKRQQQQAAQHFGGGGGGGITKGGMLEAGYETFAAAAARSGFVGGGGGGAGSPSEERGWLNFIPNLLLSRGDTSAQRQKSHASVSSSEIDPLFMRRDESSNPDLPPSINRVDDSGIPNNATRYTHFADTFHSRHSSSASFDVQNPPINDRPVSSLPDLSEEMTDVYSIGVYNDAGRMESLLAIGTTTPKFSTFKSFPVRATAVGGVMPTTPNTPVFERPKEVNNNGTFIGGFGVSVKMIPTESTELLHPSPGEHSSHANAGTSQFYSFHNNYPDEYPSKDNANNAAYSTFLNDLGQSGEYDGGDEEERTSSNNMISFYSGEGANEGFRYVRSPSKASRRQHSSQKYPENTQHSSPRPPSGSSTKEPIADSGGGNFILSLLFGNSRDSILNNMTVPSQAPASQGRGVVGSSSGEGKRDRRRPGSRQRRAAAAAKRKQARLRKQRRLRRQNERVPRHLRLSHQRAAAITER